jgi:hypothetical protein
LKVNWSFEGACHLHLQDWRIRRERNQHVGGSNCFQVAKMSLCIFTYQPVCPVYVSACLFIHTSIHPSIHPSISVHYRITVYIHHSIQHVHVFLKTLILAVAWSVVNRFYLILCNPSSAQSNFILWVGSNHAKCTYCPSAWTHLIKMCGIDKKWFTLTKCSSYELPVLIWVLNRVHVFLKSLISNLPSSMILMFTYWKHALIYLFSGVCGAEMATINTRRDDTGPEAWVVWRHLSIMVWRSRQLCDGAATCVRIFVLRRMNATSSILLAWRISTRRCRDVEWGTWFCLERKILKSLTVKTVILYATFQDAENCHHYASSNTELCDNNWGDNIVICCLYRWKRTSR